MQLIQGGVQSDNAAEGVLANLKASLQLLAAAAHDQVVHFESPDFDSKTDEMALDYDHWSTAVRSFWKLSDRQMALLEAINGYLESLSGEDNIAFWSDQALFDDPRWEEVRTMAKATLESFGWDVDVPLRERILDG